jgi:hypothetical protein
MNKCPHCGGELRAERPQSGEMVMVPREPTGEMHAAAIEEHDRSRAFIPLRDKCAGIWRAMYDAAKLKTPDCPHVAPFRYCETCVVSPCPIGLGKLAAAEAERKT